ncbi:EAL and HDOD domain-containing protein [Bordetella sp. FB-8]|uniref:EAL and HDOD domain-containing protein n=1 Tax=Bordetella sp. FB-8 TaxID=1159870 RepID=UPI00036B5C3F|nr:EAL domain-containing protein [Bordetella sp. FB-8]
MNIEGNSETLIARQAIMNRQSECVAHELLFRGRSRDTSAVVDDGFASTMTVVQNLLGRIGIETVLGEGDGFLNCPDEFLASGFIDILPARRMVLEILESSRLGDALARRCRALRSRGFRIALDDVRAINPEMLAFLSNVDLVKIDWPYVDLDTATRITQACHAAGKIVLAEKVETPEDYAQALEIGCDLFQGFYFTRPQLLKSGNKATENSAALLGILDLVLQEADIEDIEHALKIVPSLTVKFLRLANSSSLWRTHMSEITSVRKALSLVGYKQLARWCCFMLYGADKNGETDPLAQLVMRRADFMERIAHKISPFDERLQHQAYLSALLSLAHIPQGSDAHSFMSGVAVGEAIREAVVSHSGWLGTLLTVAECAERGDFPTQAQLADLCPEGQPEALLDGLYL